MATQSQKRYVWDRPGITLLSYWEGIKENQVLSEYEIWACLFLAEKKNWVLNTSERMVIVELKSRIQRQQESEKQRLLKQEIVTKKHEAEYKWALIQSRKKVTVPVPKKVAVLTQAIQKSIDREQGKKAVLEYKQKLQADALKYKTETRVNALTHEEIQAHLFYSIGELYEQVVQA